MEYELVIHADLPTAAADRLMEAFDAAVIKYDGDNDPHLRAEEIDSIWLHHGEKLERLQQWVWDQGEEIEGLRETNAFEVVEVEDDRE